ncbi:hypothetical protein [Psychrobacter sp. 72-O-c]|uniref:hypothetical protein n=1 Tax=Psychrobacter sp. 72-O-c TaxID=2774125 RepID=UPI00191A709F|nr:hypothetical protein [Psychrobacter sp. 72-O-c]
MFKFLTPKPDADLYNTAITHRITTARLRQKPTLLAATLVGTLMLIGCQQQSAPEPIVDNDSKTSEQISAEDNKSVVQSDSAAARIEQFQPLYVAQAQRLQRRLQAEYESLQAADETDSENSLLLNSATETSDDASNSDNKNNDNTTATSSNPTANTDNATTEAAGIDAEVNTSTEVGERDLTVLKRISLEPRKPIILDEEQIIERYQQATEALYQPVTMAFSDQDINTLLNIATLVPQLFEHAEIAGRVNAKSPALARLIIQHQVWEQIEAQQVLDMQQMKLDQQQEFESLMTKFNDTIKGYDEQIAKYEQTLKSFQ